MNADALWEGLTQSELGGGCEGGASPSEKTGVPTSLSPSKSRSAPPRGRALLRAMRGIPSVGIDMYKKRPFSVHILRDVYRKRPFLVHIPLSSLCVEWGGECGESPVARRKRGDYGGRFRGWERRSRSWRGCGRSPCSSPWRSDSRPQGESYSYSHRCPS